MKKEVTCPWCDQKTPGKEQNIQNEYGAVVERRCTECGKILASYPAGEGDFMPKIRVFEHS